MKRNQMRELRVGAELRQTEIAAELGADNQTVCRWEKLGQELRKADADAFELLVRDSERVATIKAGRRMKRRLVRFGWKKLSRASCEGKSLQASDDRLRSDFRLDPDLSSEKTGIRGQRLG